jgi:tRNA(fMet)-specific endonuclease VapC
MKYLLDTNAASAILRGKPPQIKARLVEAFARGDHVGIPVIVAFELKFGVVKSNFREDQEKRVNLFLSRFDPPTSFIPEDAEFAAEIRGYLQPRGEMIGPYDLLIAAQTLRLGATLVTANVREFARVPGLVFEDWSLP